MLFAYYSLGNSVPSTVDAQGTLTELLQCEYILICTCTNIAISVKATALKINTCKRYEWPEWNTFPVFQWFVVAFDGTLRITAVSVVNLPFGLFCQLND